MCCSLEMLMQKLITEILGPLESQEPSGTTSRSTQARRLMLLQGNGRRVLVSAGL